VERIGSFCFKPIPEEDNRKKREITINQNGGRNNSGGGTASCNSLPCLPKGNKSPSRIAGEIRGKKKEIYEGEKIILGRENKSSRKTTNPKLAKAG